MKNRLIRFWWFLMYRFRTLAKEIESFLSFNASIFEIGFHWIKVLPILFYGRHDCTFFNIKRDIAFFFWPFENCSICEFFWMLFWLKAYSVGKSTFCAVCNSNWKLKHRQNLFMQKIIIVHILIYFFCLLSYCFLYTTWIIIQRIVTSYIT